MSVVTSTVPIGDTRVVDPPLMLWERELLEMCRRLRESNKPLIVIVRWDGLTWAFQEAKPPVRVPERT